MTKYTMAMKFAEILGVDNTHIRKVDAVDEKSAVSRPVDCKMDSTRLRELGVFGGGVDFEGWWRWYLRAYRH